MHEEKNTFSVDVNLPGIGGQRKTTSLFERTRKVLLDSEGGRCWICHCTAEEVGHPLEAHHYPVERSFTDMIDWSPESPIRKDFPNFDWPSFDAIVPINPYLFVDDMSVNGRILCKPHHIGKDEGVHCLPEPIWLAQRYALDGYVFSNIEVIHHD